MAKVKLFAIEGNRLSIDGGAMFGNAPKTMWEKWMQPDSENRVELSARALLVQTDEGKNYLFEAGVGAFFEPKLKKRYCIKEKEHVLLKNLEKLGLDEKDIDGVILSHLHFDHAGGLLPAYDNNTSKLHFPNASYYVSKEHWAIAQNPHPREKASFIPLLHDLLKKSGRLVLIDEASNNNLNFGLCFQFSNGHTKGLMLSQIDLPSGPLVFVSDLIPGMPWVHVPITLGYDRYPELKVDEKKQLFDSFADKKAKLFFTHDPKVVCAELKKDENGKYFAEPVSLDSCNR